MQKSESPLLTSSAPREAQRDSADVSHDRVELAPRRVIEQHERRSGQGSSYPRKVDRPGFDPSPFTVAGTEIEHTMMPGFTESSLGGHSHDGGNTCALCGGRYHWVCNRPQRCSACRAKMCGTCAPPGCGGLRFCQLCVRDPRSEFKRLSAVLEKYPEDPDVWAVVAGEMDSDSSLVAVSGKTYSQWMCYARAIELRPGRQHWAALARSMPPGGFVDLRLPGKGTHRLTKFDCYANALYLYPEDSRIWTNLASDMSPSQLVTVDGRQYNQLSAILNVLEISDRECAAAWALLGLALHGMRHKDSIFVNQQKFTMIECFEKALELQPKRASTWNNLANILPGTAYWDPDHDHAVEEPLFCSFVASISNNPSMARLHEQVHHGDPTSRDAASPPSLTAAHALHTPQHTLDAGSFMTQGGGSVKHQLSVMSTAQRSVTANFLLNDRGPAPCMRGFVTLNGKRYGKLDCALMATKLAPTDSRVRFNLACAIDEHHPVKVDGRTYTKEDVFRDVLEHSRNLTSVNMRCRLMMLFPKHPRLQEYDSRYEFDETRMLGAGAYGSVFEASEVDYVTGEKKDNLAAKVIDNFGVQSAVRDMLSSVDEVRTLIDVRFSRQHIVQCKHVRADCDKDRLIIFLERALGSLNDRVKGRLEYDPLRRCFSRVRGLPRPSTEGILFQASQFEYRLHEAEIRYSAARVLECLEEMHQLGAAHQDIKPDNVLIFEGGLIKLGDLGSVAQTRGGRRKPGGTDPYLAPEALREIADGAYLQHQRQREVTTPSVVGRHTVKRDVWSWAALVIHLATGRVPLKTVPIQFDKETRDFRVDFSEGYQPMLSNEAGVPHIPATLSRELREVLRACLRPSAHDRPPVHEVLTMPYFTREGLPADVETVALHEDRKARAFARAQAGGAAASPGGLDEEWHLLYRDLPLYGPPADDPQSPHLLWSRTVNVASPRTFEDGLTRDDSRAPVGPGVKALPHEILSRMRNIAENNFDVTSN
jgi:serine/threonine protein kinase